MVINKSDESVTILLMVINKSDEFMSNMILPK